ncbi:MAG: hypothetical protein WEC83_02325 [Patescibacteria group bacterium]
MAKRGKRSGSALIMVMLVVASITTIVFATQRIALVQFSQSVREEDNLAAYYAAKAGIEDGLLRYHFERNVQTYRNDQADESSVFRFDLTAGAAPDSAGDVPYEIPADTKITEGIDGDFDPGHQYYDLAISYKTKTIGIDSENGALQFSPERTLAADDTLTLTGFPTSNLPYFLRYAFKFDAACANLSQARVTLQQIITSNDGLSESSSQVLVESSQATLNAQDELVYDSGVNVANLPIRTDAGDLVSSVRIRAYYCDLQYAFATSLNIDGLGGDNDDPEFDSLISEIVSTGYYGGAKRTLVAAVNRQTGDLIGIFDFLLYSGGNTGTIRR